MGLFNTEIQFGKLHISNISRPIFIAEIGINHNGDLETAKQLIYEAVEAGADVVKFQTHIPVAEMIPSHPLWDVIARNTLTVGELIKCRDTAYSCGVEFLTTPFSIQAVNESGALGLKAFKTGSGELTHIPLQMAIAHTRLPTFISTGMSSLEEVKRTVAAVSRINPNIVLMNCCSVYPCKPEQINLERMIKLMDFAPLVGQSDHCPSISTALGAIALGACVIEKHFTLDRDWEGPDHSGSLLPREFEQMVVLGKEIWEASKDDARTGYLDEEAEVRNWAHHFCVTKREVRVGQPLTESNVTFKRVGASGYIPAAELPSLIGARARFRADLPAGRPVRFADVYEPIPAVD